jgi:flagellar motor switch protein FliG
MSMLARYKKGGGILELVKLVEDSPEPKRSQLMAMVRNEDPEFAARIEARIFNWDKIKTLQENVIAEIIGAAPAKFLAVALVGEDAEFVKLAERCVGKNFADYKAEKDTLSGLPPALIAIESARRKVIAEARKLEAAGQIKLTSGDTDAAMAAGGGASNANSGAATNAASPGSAGSASADSGVPPIASFGLELPPPGLSGERFQTYIKSLLGF